MILHCRLGFRELSCSMFYLLFFSTFGTKLEEHTDTVSEAAEFAKSNGTKNKNFLNDWEMMLALAVENGWKKQINEMAKV